MRLSYCLQGETQVTLRKASKEFFSNRSYNAEHNNCIKNFQLTNIWVYQRSDLFLMVKKKPSSQFDLNAMLNLFELKLEKQQ